MGEHTAWVDGQGAYCSCPWYFQDNTGDDEVPYRAASQHLALVKSQAEIAEAEQEESEPGPNIPIMEVEDLAESGLLWYINATAFHPHGVALTYSDADGEIHFGLTPALPGEPYSFPDDPYIHERYRAAMATLARARDYTEESPAFTRAPWETMPAPGWPPMTEGSRTLLQISGPEGSRASLKRTHGSWWLLTCETYAWRQDRFIAEGTHAEVTSEWFEHIERDH